MPLQGRLGGALFYDTGNVFGRVADDELRLQHAVGIGLRYDSAVGLIRVDLGIPLNRRPGEERYQLFFGLGEAF